MLKPVVFLISILLSVVSVMAEDGKVSGKIVDAETGEVLPFTTIQVEGTGSGTVANIEGRFILDISQLSNDEIVLFSHVGYKTARIPVQQLNEELTVRLEVSPLNLQSVEVYSRELTAKEIIMQVVENYAKNYPKRDIKQQLFYHRIERTPWGDENTIKLKKSDFAGFDKASLEEVFSKLPDEFVEYQDAILDLYRMGDDHKLIARQAISLEEGSMRELSKEMEERFRVFAEDIEESRKDEDVYYKFRSGIFAAKMDDDDQEPSEDSSSIFDDTVHYNISTQYAKNDLLKIMKDYASLEGENWEFLSKTGRYKYEIEKVTLFNDEVVYKINFSPRARGLYEGFMYVSTKSYAVLQLDYQFAGGKSDQNFQLLGVGHSMRYKRGRVIFERIDDAYYLKYIYANQNEYVSVDRNFSLMKKQKRFLIDKELNEMKFNLDLQFDMDSNFEILVQNREPITGSIFEGIEEEKTLKYKIEYSNSPDIWENQTVIAPTTELTRFQRSE